MFSSKPTAAVIILNTEPGSYLSVRALFLHIPYKALAFCSEVIFFQSESEMLDTLEGLFKL